MISGIYAKRKFSIRVDQMISSEREQKSGIAQGCPLSPYLFIIMMTTMFQDIDIEIQNFIGEDNTPEYIASRDILYADDTILVGSPRDQMQYYIDTVVRCARNYGLELNWSKTKLLRIRADGLILTPDGIPIECADQAIYLGALLTSSGLQSKEIGRRIGEANNIFQILKAI